MLNKILIICALIGASFTLSAQDFAELDKSPLDAVYYPTRAAFRGFAETPDEMAALEPKIRVLYSRPYLNGRKVWGGDLAPYDTPYRLGANETSEIQFFTDVTIGDTEVPAGRYTFGAVPNEDSWEVFFTSALDGWGVYAYKAEDNVASVTVPTQSMEEALENFSITMYEAESGDVHLKMGWDKTFVEVPITLK